MLWNTLYDIPINSIFSTSWHIGNHLSYFICLFQKYYLSFLSNRIYKQHQSLYLFFNWGPEPNDHSVVSSLVSVKVFQRDCVWVFWSKILWKQYWYIASKKMYGKTARAWTDCSCGNLDFIQKWVQPWEPSFYGGGLKKNQNVCWVFTKDWSPTPWKLFSMALMCL